MKKCLSIILFILLVLSCVSIVGASHRMRIDGSASIDCLLIDGSGHVLYIDGHHAGGGFHRPGRVLGGGMH